jgi:hypothetical protein
MPDEQDREAANPMVFRLVIARIPPGGSRGNRVRTRGLPTADGVSLATTE